jgi:hypothetical protein
MRLFWSKRYLKHWIAFSEATGLVIFPAEIDGWQKRQPADEVLAEELREIPVRMAANAGMPVTNARKRGRKAA